MSEIYSTTERAIIFTIIYAVSFIVSLIFLYRRVDYKKTSLIIFIFMLDIFFIIRFPKYNRNV